MLCLPKIPLRAYEGLRCSPKNPQRPQPRSGDRSLSPGWSRQAEPWVEPPTKRALWRGGRKAISAWGSRLTLALRLRQEPWHLARSFSRGKNGYATESPTGAPEQVPEYGLTASPPSLVHVVFATKQRRSVLPSASLGMISGAPPGLFRLLHPVPRLKPRAKFRGPCRGREACVCARVNATQGNGPSGP